MRASGKNIIQEKNEMLLRVKTNTVVDPWAMVVHSSYAVFTCRAMMRMRRFDTVTFLAFF